MPAPVRHRRRRRWSQPIGAPTRRAAVLRRAGGGARWHERPEDGSVSGIGVAVRDGVPVVFRDTAGVVSVLGPLL